MMRIYEATVTLGHGDTDKRTQRDTRGTNKTEAQTEKHRKTQKNTVTSYKLQKRDAGGEDGLAPGGMESSLGFTTSVVFFSSSFPSLCWILTLVLYRQWRPRPSRCFSITCSIGSGDLANDGPVLICAEYRNIK